MNYYTMLFDDEVLITILKVINLNRDLKELILDKVMADTINNIEEECSNSNEVTNILQLIENEFPSQDYIGDRIMISFLINNDLLFLQNGPFMGHQGQR